MSYEQGGTYSVFRSVINNNTTLTLNSSPNFNETIHFSGDTSHRELVYSSWVKETLNLPIEVLTNDSQTSRLALKNMRKGTKIIPRPQNAWIIYRRDKYAGPEFEGIKSSVASVKIGERWRGETKEVVEYFVALSMLALENHQNKYGDYKYNPKQRTSKKCKNKKQSKENTSPDTKISNENFPPSSPTNGYLPTPISSIPHSPVTSQDEQINNNSYLITPASSNQHSPATFQDFLNEDFINQYLSMNPNIGMFPNMSAITPNFSINNNSFVIPEDTSEFIYNAELLATQSLPDMIDNNDFYLPGHETLMSNITAETIANDVDQFLQSHNLPEYDDYDLFSNNIETPFLDQLEYYEINGQSL